MNTNPVYQREEEMAPTAARIGLFGRHDIAGFTRKPPL
jgi:hypothetical protein